MKDMVMFWLYVLFAVVDFGLAVNNLRNGRYFMFGWGLVLGIIFTLSAAALFIINVLL